MINNSRAEFISYIVINFFVFEHIVSFISNLNTIYYLTIYFKKTELPHFSHVALTHSTLINTIYVQFFPLKKDQQHQF